MGSKREEKREIDGAQSCIERVCTYCGVKAHNSAAKWKCSGDWAAQPVGCQIPRKYRNCVKAGKRITSSLNLNKAKCSAVRHVRQREKKIREATVQNYGFTALQMRQRSLGMEENRGKWHDVVVKRKYPISVCSRDEVVARYFYSLAYIARK